MISCVIVDDEVIARRGIERYVEQIPFMKCIASVRTAAEVLPHLDKTDLLILDIQMPQQTGLDFLKNQSKAPVTIIITAYPEYALKGFELGVIDYIVKPASFERFGKACAKAKEYIELLRKGSEQSTNDFFYIKCDHRIEKILLKDVLYIEAKENYSCIYTSQNKYMTLVNLGAMEEKLNPTIFVRVHKSFIVSTRKIDRMDGSTLWVGSVKIPLSRRVKKELKETLLKP